MIISRVLTKKIFSNLVTYKSVNQQKYLDILNKKNNYILTVVGPAGTGKTFLSSISAINQLKENKIEKIIISRPATSVDEDIGFLPGNIDKKMYPWTRPIFDVFLKYYSNKELNNMLASSIIEICPLCFMRGRTFDNSFIIADEMQNSTPNQMLMLLTRIGENSKMVITGDLEQSDKLENNGLKDYYNKLKRNTKENNLYIIEMTNNDIQRSILVNEVLNLYNNTITNNTTNNNITNNNITNNDTTNNDTTKNITNIITGQNMSRINITKRIEDILKKEEKMISEIYSNTSKEMSVNIKNDSEIIKLKKNTTKSSINKKYRKNKDDDCALIPIEDYIKLEKYGAK